MKKYIIKYDNVFNDVADKKVFYHETISECTNKQVMNVYVESISSYKKKAKVFFDKAEAERVLLMFEQHYRKPTILIK